MKTILAILITLSVVSVLHAQLLPSRNMFPELNPDSTKSSGFMTRTKFFGEIMCGFQSAGDDRAWDATIGGFADVYTWNGFTSIRVRFAQEMLANGMNDISFNPRSMQYEENISGVFHTPWFDWEAGLTYRCKHDIDNTDPVNSDVTPLVDSNAQKRVVILGGVYIAEGGRYSLLDVLGLGSTLVPANIFFRFDYYPLHEDNRFPGNANGILWSDVLASLLFSIRVDIVSLSSATAYMQLVASEYYWKGMKFNSQGGDNERFETGLHFAGAVGGIDAFVAYEHLFDDLSIPEPRASNTISVGLRIN